MQVIDFSQHRLELISKDEYLKPPARQSNSKEYGLIKKKGVRYMYVHLLTCMYLYYFYDEKFLWRFLLKILSLFF